MRICGGPIDLTQSDRLGERRWMTIGDMDGKEFDVVQAGWNGSKRVIAAERALSNEQKKYQRHVARGGDPPEERGEN